jgi:hypothetical protein
VKKKDFSEISYQQKKSCGLLGYQGKRVREPNEAPGQLVSKMEGIYKPDATAFYRNDGHKHLKSKGILC